MMLLRRIIRRSEWAMRKIKDAQLRRTLPPRPRAQRVPVALMDLPSHAALVVTAHPDDEAIAVGGLLTKFPRAGVICVTNGAPRRGNQARDAGFDNWMDYASQRRREAEAGLALHGREIEPNYSLGIPDQEAALNLVAITHYLASRIRTGFRYIITHAYEGGHPDHDSVAFCVHAACALIAKEGGTPPVIAEAAFYNAPEGKFAFTKFLHHDDAGPVASFQLSPAEQDRKRRMFDCHVTQRAVLAEFGVTEENYRQAPRYHFSAPPHAGEVGYNLFMGAFTGSVWRQHAWVAMRQLGLLEELA